VREAGVSCEHRDTSGARPREKREKRVRHGFGSERHATQIQTNPAQLDVSREGTSLSLGPPRGFIERPTRETAASRIELQRGSVRVGQCLHPMLFTALYSPDPQFSFPWSKDLRVSKNCCCVRTDGSDGVVGERNGHLVSLVRGGNLPS